MPDDNVPYDIGYRKPPRETRFKPGQSGNPKGRPRKTSRSPLEMFRGILNEKVTIHDSNGETKRLSRLEIASHATMLKAMKGDIKAFNSIISLCRALGIMVPEIKDEQMRGGVLVVPEAISEKLWEVKALEYRKQTLELDGNIKKELTAYRAAGTETGKLPE